MGLHRCDAVEAARVRATLGEISYACEKIVGRYKAVIRTISGVYSSESKNDSDFKRACELAEKFAVCICLFGHKNHAPFYCDYNAKKQSVQW